MADSKLDNILKDLLPLAQQGKVTQFLTNAEVADRLDSMADDIRDAMMEYQVCPQLFGPTQPNAHVRLRYNKTSFTRAASSL